MRILFDFEFGGPKIPVSTEVVKECRRFGFIRKKSRFFIPVHNEPHGKTFMISNRYLNDE